MALAIGDKLIDRTRRRAYLVTGLGPGVVSYREWHDPAESPVPRVGSRLELEVALETGEVERVGGPKKGGR